MDDFGRWLNPLVQLLQDRVGRSPKRPALRFRDHQRPDFIDWTWEELRDRAWTAASNLQSLGIRPGNHVVLAVSDVQDAVTCLFGIWTAGAVPIQIGLPYGAKAGKGLARHLVETAKELDAGTIITSADVASLACQHSGVAFIRGEGLANGSRMLVQPTEIVGPALIQLTSGSLGRPRGVVIPADRLMRHLEAISQALPPGENAVGVSWLPLHHDMGLIGGLLYPLYNNVIVHLLSTEMFRKWPYEWLSTLSEVGATHTVAPPAAFALASRLSRRAVADDLDLSRLQCAMVGAEPIPPAILRNFASAFAPCGFRAEAFFPVYGLAEATVAVTFPKPLTATAVDRIDPSALQCSGRAKPSDADNALEFTGVGAPIVGTKIRIASDLGDDMPERSIGEIQIHTETGMIGYYGDVDATERIFQDGWLRTGDLGYIADETLYVTGRAKEIIIRGGRNLLPQSVEEVAFSVQGVRQGSAAAVGVGSESRGTERAVLVVETALRADLHAQLVASIAGALQDRALDVDEIKLVSPHTLPRTTSGKIRRTVLAGMLAAGRTSKSRDSR